MKLGPFSPQELDETAQYLISKNIEFEISFDEQEAHKELRDSPENTVNLAEFRLKTYLAQHFYIIIAPEELAKNPNLYKELIHKTTKTHLTESQDFSSENESSNVYDIREDQIMKARSEKTKSIQKWIALIFLLTMLATYIYPIVQKIINK